MLKTRLFRQIRRISFQYWLIYFILIVFVIIVNIAIYTSYIPIDQPCNCRQCEKKYSIKYFDVDELTFVSVPRPLKKDKQKRTMKLALSSWLACSPKSRVLLFIERDEFDPTGKIPDEIDNIFGKDRVIYAGGIRCDHSGVPYIHEWFIQGIKQSPSKYITFINSDILLSENWLKRVKQIFNIMDDKPTVLIGQRIDFDLKGEKFQKLIFSQDKLLNSIDNMVQESKHSDHSPFGIDTFTFRADKPPFDPEMIPPFMMGRYNWDNWLIGWFNRICDTVTFNLDPPIYHINHNRHSFNVNDSKVAINHHLKQANMNYFGSNFDTKWEVKNGFLVRRNSNEKIELKPLSEE
ncbi:hypothetical protein TRFO_06211 [Tritrichomonas foetus]|uniref:Uncharacterized protein n=1 Tax=Tritrichomonas foetus TaxID=1144522 RepID=A0A1J4K513_9EUKA|nr:hypothetical protein TRFO_06211 [Tritrichomonas foetus]|eukprot:OHT04766.1 hypothetical protein TRFO_06211 [Tritrichomonas foetus]